MKKNEKQSGNVLGIFLIIIVIGMVGVLGFMVWQKSMTDKGQNAADSGTNALMDHNMDNMDMSH